MRVDITQDQKDLLNMLLDEHICNLKSDGVPEDDWTFVVAEQTVVAVNKASKSTWSRVPPIYDEFDI